MSVVPLINYEARTEIVIKYLEDIIKDIKGKSVSNCAIVVITSDEVYSGTATGKEAFVMIGALEHLKLKIREDDLPNV